MPLSIRLTKFRSTLADNVSCSCVRPASRRIERKTFPNVTAGSTRFSQYTGQKLEPCTNTSLRHIFVIQPAAPTNYVRAGHRNGQHDVLGVSSGHRTASVFVCLPN